MAVESVTPSFVDDDVSLRYYDMTIWLLEGMIHNDPKEELFVNVRLIGIRVTNVYMHA